MTPNELSEKLWNNVERVAKYLLPPPNARLDGQEWIAGNIHGEAGKSLKINLSGKKVWSDFATGEGGIYLICGC